MADKRMFSKQMIDSDAFLEMPLSAQALYFHLAMRADDDGFVDNSKRIQRTIGASNADYKILTDKRYILTFPSGVSVIKHWRIHNTIQKDRYKETVYIEEKSTLVMKENKSYTEKNRCLAASRDLETECMQNGNSLETQISIDKNREDKNSISVVPDFEKAWDKTFELYPKKNAAVLAKQTWMNKILGVIEFNRTDVATLIYRAVKAYLEDYRRKNQNDDNYRYAPSFNKWLDNDCDYWIREVEKNDRS